MDEAHGRLSGPATLAILKREYTLFGRQEFKRLSTISSAHLYRLRRFVIRGFHSDNGSEFVNRVVVGLLSKLLIEFTKSRAPTHQRPSPGGEQERQCGA